MDKKSENTQKKIVARSLPNGLYELAIEEQKEQREKMLIATGGIDPAELQEIAEREGFDD